MMYNQMQQQQLPYPANQLIQGGQPQFIPQIPVAPQMQPYVALAMSCLVQTLQQHAQRNPLRVFLYNQLSANGFNNPDLGPALLGVVEYAQMLLMQSQCAPEQAIPAAAESLCGWLAATNAKKFPMLYQMLDQNTAMDVERKCAEFLQVQQRVAGPQQQQMPMRGNVQSVQPINNNWAGGQQNFRQPMANMAAQPPQWQPPQQSFQQPMSTPLDVTIGNGKFKSQRALESATFTPGQQPVVETQARAVATAPFSPKYEMNVQQQVQLPEPAKKVEITFGTEVKPHKVSEDGVKEIIIDGCPVRFAASSGWVRTQTAEAPYSFAYDPTTHAAFHKRLPDGSVVEFLVDIDEMTPEMDYLTHELKPCFREVAAVKDDKVVIPNWKAVELIKPVEVLKQEAAEEGGIAAMAEALALPPIFDAFSDSHAEIQAQVEISTLGIPVGANSVLEFYYNRNEYVMVESNMNKIMAAIEDTDDIVDAAESFVRIKGMIPERMWYALHERVTYRINEALCVNMQLEQWNIESFVDDVADLIAELRKNKGELFAAAFEVNGGKIIASALRSIRGDHYIDLVEDLGKFVEGEEPSILIMSELCSTTLVSWRSTDIRVRLQRDGSAVMESLTPALYHAVKGIFDRCEKVTGNFADHYIITADNVKLKVHRGFIGKESYLISIA